MNLIKNTTIQLTFLTILFPTAYAWTNKIVFSNQTGHDITVALYIATEDGGNFMYSPSITTPFTVKNGSTEAVSIYPSQTTHNDYFDVEWNIFDNSGNYMGNFDLYGKESSHTYSYYVSTNKFTSQSQSVLAYHHELIDCPYEVKVDTTDNNQAFELDLSQYGFPCQTNT